MQDRYVCDTPDNVRVGIIGGGQLGRMLSLAASKLGYKTCVFAESEQDPATFVTNSCVIGSFSDEDKLREFSSIVDFAIIEFENIPIDSIYSLQQTIPVYPGDTALYVAQNRIREKKHVESLGVAVSKFSVISNFEELCVALDVVGMPAVLKTAEHGYDGKGQYVLRTHNDAHSLSHLRFEQGYILEKLVDLKEELSVIVAIGKDGAYTFFPIAHNTHVDGVLVESSVPAIISESLCVEVQNVALSIAKSLNLVGILAVEFFVTVDGKLLVNEIAPRPHNSGHWSLDSCNISQFEQLVRIACGLPLREVHLLVPCTMKNVFSDNAIDPAVYADSRSCVSLYGKAPRKKRKMGHVNSLLF
ncbi:5-(carboxyamino)imidazole ribonucleotide synthase [Candidatus Anaplasma sp. TIGMIC]|uniref:5-(carboxyamino)imidazole ribonucleotide synthase n=1 Tax=Candidatus Anaplasma sp. TIGMIC TaxID=3020713 RepID=UPI00232B4273|nr:5-(carboxyamino)imidazole ribonucleotide synthase [Candidatus Anaplasma sp. TIGMIC]MDB1135744.1 5-(carboxyamino)imidazole ribonucleotide synthase [Candidatus Anaplasma sp. TIGMIC]